MHDVSIGGRHRKVADTWNALPRKQLLEVVRHLYAKHRTETDLRLWLLSVLLDVPLALVIHFTDVQVAQLLWLTDFLLEENSLTEQKLGSVQLPAWRDPLRRTFYGPREHFRNMSFAEFIFADAYFVRYSQDRSQVAMLDKLVAVLYRPQRRNYDPNSPEFGGDRREDFNEHLLEKRVFMLEALPSTEKLAIYTWYAGCRKALEYAYPDVFTSAHQEQASAKGWDYVLRELSGSTFGTLTETSRQNARLVLAKMQDDQEAAERLRELHRQHNP
ncbi:hypothetical protein [Hymenobacter norwichensis]|uniref:hypothetical protein n=1 Tax=Hymenobacter norwichensis TaxID=223903 RepID=UPI0003B4585C|nr:hypothetical protein [Hymenobacter norwichensis]